MIHTPLRNVSDFIECNTYSSYSAGARRTTPPSRKKKSSPHGLRWSRSNLPPSSSNPLCSRPPSPNASTLLYSRRTEHSRGDAIRNARCIVRSFVGAAVGDIPSHRSITPLKRRKSGRGSRPDSDSISNGRH